MDIIQRHIEEENRLMTKDSGPPGNRDYKNDPRIIVAERKNKLNKDTRTPPRIGDKVYFEVDDELHDGSVRMVHAKVVRQYPKKKGKNKEYLAFDCIDLDQKNIYYTVPYDKEFVKTDPG